MEDLIPRIKQYVLLKAELEKIETQIQVLREDFFRELQKRNLNRLDVEPFYIEHRQIKQERISRKDIPLNIWEQYCKTHTVSQLIVSTKGKERRSRSRSPSRKNNNHSN
jgi:hypothetical protein